MRTKKEKSQAGDAMPFPKKIDETLIQEIQDLRAQGKNKKQAKAILDERHDGKGPSMPTIKKYWMDSELKPPESAEQREEAAPAVYSGIVPPARPRTETKTIYSEPVDEIKDIARGVEARKVIDLLAGSRESVVDQMLKLNELSKQQQAPLQDQIEERDARITELERMVGELKRRDERGEYLLGVERLRGEQQVATTNLQLSIEELRHSNLIEMKKLELGSEKVQNTKFLLDHGPEAIEKLGMAGEKLAEGLVRGVMKMGVNPGQLLGRIRGAVDTTVEMVDPELGGLVTEQPVKLKDLRRRVIRVGRGVEVVPRSDEEIEEFAEAMESYVNEADKPEHGRDLGRESRLANENAILKRRLAEFEPKAPEAAHSRRVAVAGSRAIEGSIEEADNDTEKQ